MATTLKGLIYPDSTGSARIWEHVQNLATSADTAIGTAASAAQTAAIAATTQPDTGWLTVGITATGSGGTVSGINMRKIGALAYVSFGITVGTAITVPSNGDIANTTMAQITDNRFWPSKAWMMTQGAAGTLTSWYVTTAGLIQLTATTPGTSLAVATALSANGSWLV